MATKFVFEDNDATPSSKLLKDCVNGANIYFSGGSGSVLKKAISIQSPGDTIYIFYDVSPNNKHKVNKYYNTLNNIEVL